MLELQHAEDPFMSRAYEMFDVLYLSLKDRAKAFVEAAGAHLNDSVGHQ